MSSNNVFEARSLLQGSQSVLIALGNIQDEDVVASGLALYLILTKMRKQVTIVASDKTKVEMAHLFAVDKITTKMAGGSSLVISMPYEEGTIEKVSYNIDNGKFNLVVEPRGENLNFNPDQVDFNYGRGDYDIVFVLGAQNVTSLGNLYNRHKNIFSDKPIINIDKSSQNTGFGRVNIVDNAPISQLVAELLKNLRMPIDQDPASNLYTGIIGTYGGLTLDTVSPEVLDTISYLRRAKAQNLRQGSGSKQNTQHNQPKQAQSGFEQQKSNQVQKQQIQEKNQKQKHQYEPQQNQPNKQNMQNSQQHGTLVSDEVANQPTQEAPEDWLKPKIFTTDKN